MVDIISFFLHSITGLCWCAETVKVILLPHSKSVAIGYTRGEGEVPHASSWESEMIRHWNKTKQSKQSMMSFYITTHLSHHKRQRQRQPNFKTPNCKRRRGRGMTNLQFPSLHQTNVSFFSIDTQYPEIPPSFNFCGGNTNYSRIRQQFYNFARDMGKKGEKILIFPSLIYQKDPFLFFSPFLFSFFSLSDVHTTSLTHTYLNEIPIHLVHILESF